MILLISPSVGGVGIAEYVCAHPCVTNYFYRGWSRLHSRRRWVGRCPTPNRACEPRDPHKATMMWYSDEAMEAFAIVVWSLAFVLFLVALALPCPLCRRDVKDWSTCCNKCVTSLLGLVFVSHLVTSDEGTLQFARNQISAGWHATSSKICTKTLW
jgi:hypothetical protein